MERSDALRGRIKAALRGMGGDTPQNRRLLARDAVATIEHALTNLEQFGEGRMGTEPEQLALAGLHGLLDTERSFLTKNCDRWERVLGYRESAAANGQPQEIDEPDEPDEPDEHEPEAIAGTAASATRRSDEPDDHVEPDEPDEPLDPQLVDREQRDYELRERLAAAEKLSAVLQGRDKVGEQLVTVLTEQRDELEVRLQAAEEELEEADASVAEIRSAYAEELLSRVRELREPGDDLLDRLDSLAGLK